MGDPEDFRKPPIFSTWGRMYVFVLAFLGLLILLFYLLTEAYA